MTGKTALSESPANMGPLTTAPNDSPITTATARSNQKPRLLFLIPGGLLLFGAFLAAIFYIIAPLVTRARPNSLELSALLGTLMAIGFVYGGLLSWLSWRSPQRDEALRLSKWLYLIFPFLFAFSLGAGQLALTISNGAAWTFPLFHILASLLSSLAVISYAAPRLGNPSTRGLAIGFTWGGLGTILIAFILEIIAVVILFVIGILGALLLLGTDRMQQITLQLQNSLRNPDPMAIFNLLSANPLLLGLLIVLSIALLSFAVPLIEESAKVSLPAILIGRRRPTASQALWWALAAGAGYAFSENLLNGLNALDSWADGMALRGGTSFIHIATTSTLGMGFYLWFVEKKFARWVQFALIALAGHGFWNLAAITLSFVTARASGQSSTPFQFSMESFIPILLLVILVVLILLGAFWIMYLVSWAHRHDATRAVTESTIEMKNVS